MRLFLMVMNCVTCSLGIFFYVTAEGLWALGLDGSLVDEEMIEASVSFFPVQCGACQDVSQLEVASARHERPTPFLSTKLRAGLVWIQLQENRGTPRCSWVGRRTQPCSRAGGAPGERNARGFL